MDMYQQAISNKLNVLAHQTWIHANQSTREGLTHKLSFNLHSFMNHVMNFLPMKSLPQQAVRNHNKYTFNNFPSPILYSQWIQPNRK